MNSKNFALGMLLVLFVAFNSLAATINFVGNGDGTTWQDPANWDLGTVPTSADDVILNNFDNVVIAPGAAVYANSLVVRADAKLTISPNGKLFFASTSDSADQAILMRGRGTITNFGSISIAGTHDVGIYLRGNSVLTNNSSIVIQFVDNEGVFLSGETSFYNNGDFTLEGSDGDGMDINSDSFVENRGKMTLRGIEDEGINMDNRTTFNNYGTLIIQDPDGNDGICTNNSNSSFYNDGLIEISDVTNEGEGIEVNDGIFINDVNGVITMTEVNGDVLRLESGATLINNGVISASGNSTDNSDVVIELENNTVFENNNILNISGSNDVAIELENNSSLFDNTACGVVNILDDQIIELEANNATLQNDGVIATATTGDNENNGNFVNNGAINTANGTFNIAPNPLQGGGAVVVGAIPAQSACNIAIGSFGCAGSTTIDQASQTWTQTADACVPSFPYQSDNISYAFQQLCGDGSITAKVESVTPIGWGGISFRETVDDDSKMVQLMANGSTLLRRQIRNSTGSWAMPTQFPALNQKWLRIEREGNYFRGYRSPNGINWFFVFETEVSMSDCVSVGVVTNNYNVNLPATSTFTNVVIEPGVAGLEGEDTPAAQQVLDATTQTSELTANIYPNPTTGLVNVELEAIDEVVDLRIFNTLGQMVDAIRMDPSYGLNQTVNLEGMPTGTYFFHLIGEKGSKRVEQVILK